MRGIHKKCYEPNGIKTLKEERRGKASLPLSSLCDRLLGQDVLTAGSGVSLVLTAGSEVSLVLTAGSDVIDCWVRRERERERGREKGREKGHTHGAVEGRRGCWRSSG